MKSKLVLVSKHYGIDNNRGLQLYAEFITYMLQRCRCPRCSGHFNEGKGVKLLQSWPGSRLNDNEEYFLYRLLGSVMEDIILQYTLCREFSVLAVMNTAEFITMIMNKLNNLIVQVDAELNQCDPNLN